MNEIILSKRLSAAASFIRQGSVLADIGTDHAFLPIYCVTNGISHRAIAADINQMPLQRAKENIKKYNLNNKIECVLTSGFTDLDEYGITDAAVCGMGGDLIASITEAAEFIKRDGFRLIIQPMTVLQSARASLLKCGFEIIDEITLIEDNKFYTVICADYCGEIKQYDKFELLFGNFSSKHFIGDGVYEKYIQHEILKYTRIAEGKSSAGISDDEEREIIVELKEMLLL